MALEEWKLRLTSAKVEVEAELGKFGHYSIIHYEKNSQTLLLFLSDVRV